MIRGGSTDKMGETKGIRRFTWTKVRRSSVCRSGGRDEMVPGKPLHGERECQGTVGENIYNQNGIRI